MYKNGKRLQKTRITALILTALITTLHAAEFAGTVTSVDTQPFYRPAGQSPGGYAPIYNSNAESCLEIGEASGRAMLNLINVKKTK
jgi:hypothetical protein